jgi:hypothetical protein
MTIRHENNKKTEHSVISAKSTSGPANSKSLFLESGANLGTTWGAFCGIVILELWERKVQEQKLLKVFALY